MILDVSPTRMELLKLKKKRSIAKRGHKLLKDKLDEFVRHLLSLVKEIAELRNIIHSEYSRANGYFSMANSSNFPEATTAALSASSMSLTIDTSYKQLLNIRVPRYSVKSDEYSRSYGFIHTSIGLDFALEIFSQLMRYLIALAEKEKAVQMIAEEIQKTRRRVNALEYILIPNIEETIKYITMKLDENERNNQTQLMRVKDVVRAPKSQSSAYPGAGKYPI